MDEYRFHDDGHCDGNDGDTFVRIAIIAFSCILLVPSILMLLYGLLPAALFCYGFCGLLVYLTIFLEFVPFWTFPLVIAFWFPLFVYGALCKDGLSGDGLSRFLGE